MKPYCPITKQGYRVAGHDVYRKTADATPGWRKAMAKKLKKSTRQWARSMIKKEVVICCKTGDFFAFFGGKKYQVNPDETVERR